LHSNQSTCALQTTPARMRASNSSACAHPNMRAHTHKHTHNAHTSTLTQCTHKHTHCAHARTCTRAHTHTNKHKHKHTHTKTNTNTSTHTPLCCSRYGLPVLGTSMGRGLLPDDHPLCVNAARSLALAKTDVAVVVGARLNW